MRLLKLLLSGSFLFLLVVTYLHPITALTQDLGRHIKTGEIIWQTHHIPTVNLYSYTYPDFPFINHHWLSEVVFYLVSQLVGFNGLLVLMLLTITIASLLVYYSVRKANLFALGIASLLSLGILAERTDVRPEIFSFLFVSVFVIILYKFQKRFTRWIFLLPLLELLWVNMHIYFFVGPLLIGLFVLDSIISNRRKLKYLSFVMLNLIQHPRKIPKRVRDDNRVIFSFSLLLFVLLLSTIAAVFNPNGLVGALYPLTVFQNYGYQIEENQNIFFLQSLFNKQTIIFFETAVVLLFFSLLISIKKTRPVDWLLAIVFSILGIVAERNMPLFVFATFIPFVRSLSLVVARLQKKIKSSYYPLFFLVLFVASIWYGFFLLEKRPLGFGVEPGAERGADFFLSNNLSGPIFNNFDIGSYLDYRLYPKQKVFVDGRPEAYPKQFFETIYIPMQEDHAVFQNMDARYRFASIFFAHTDQTPWAQTFLRNITQNSTWVPVYLDETIVIFLKNNEANKTLIEKYKISQDSYHLPEVYRNNLKAMYRLTNLFIALGWKQQQEEVLQTILDNEPTNCQALQNLILIKQKNNDKTDEVFHQRFTMFCQ